MEDKLKKDSKPVPRTHNFDNQQALTDLAAFALVTHNLSAKKYVEQLIRDKVNSDEVRHFIKKVNKK